jgi:hypothetical protein
MNRKNETDFWQKQADEGSLLVAVHEGVNPADPHVFTLMV